jgi:hypothetical protein
MLDYSSAPVDQLGDFDLIPDKTLAWAIVKVKNYGPGGHPDDWITPSKSSDGGYLNLELTICEGPYMKRKVFEMVGVAGSEAYVNQGRAAIRAMLEVGRGANPTSNPAGYKIMDYGDLNGLKVAVKIKVEKGGLKNHTTDAQYATAESDRYPDKNRVAAWLTPNKESSAHKDWERLLSGNAQAPSAAPSVGNVASGSAAPAWAKPATTAAPVPAAPATAKPSWL